MNAGSCQYDRAFRRTKMLDVEGTRAVYSYVSPRSRASRRSTSDHDSRLSVVTEGGNTRGTYTYDPAGKLTHLVYGNSSYADYLYDPAGRLTVVSNKESDATLVSQFAYTLDNAGMRRTMAISGSAYTSASVAYDYDSAYQLTKETRTGGNAYTQSFTYDSAGNRVTKVLGGTTTQYYYDYIDRMTKAGTIAYSWEYWGNLTKIGTDKSYYWDAADRLTKFDGPGTSDDTTYVYAPGSWERVKRDKNGTVRYFVYDGDNVAAEYNSDATLAQSYVTPGLDDNLSTTTGGSTYY